MRIHLSLLAALAVLAAAPATAGPDRADGLLFRASGDKSLTADMASGAAAPNFASDVAIVPDGAQGGAMRWFDGGYVAWSAPGNIYAQRGTLSFFWRPRTAVGVAPFNIFRVGFADHSSWDMAFLRIDWNGHGFDAFVTDANLSRVRVSWTMPDTPAPDSWHAIAFSWDETRGVILYVDGKEVARRDQAADLDSGLDQFGMAGRVMAPHQVQSRYNFMRGSDLDEIRVYDHALAAADIAALADKRDPVSSAGPDDKALRTAWLHRFGWDKASPPVLDAAVTAVRKIEFADAKDLKEWMFKGVDGIAETTWPGVYNRSRLPGRDDYFELPDWNVYVGGGKQYDLTLPKGATFNRVELRGAAYGSLSWTGDDGRTVKLDKRAAGVVRSVSSFAPLTGGTLHFTNDMQEQPIQELWAYDVAPGAEPDGTAKLSYTVRADRAPAYAALTGLNAFIAGRYAPRERATVVALPTSAGVAAVGASDPTAAPPADRSGPHDPLVHILIPSSFGDAPPDRPVARAWDYGWQNMHDGLDGIAIDLPAMHATPNAQGLIPLDIRVKDPIWPERELIDVTVSVRPGEKRTLWLDLRDRILTNDSLYLTIASAAPDFDAQSLDGAQIRLVFKDRAEALKQHIADRFNQVRDNWGFLVEEHTASKRMALYRRLFADISDLLRVDPDNKLARAYWSDINYRPEAMPAFTQPVPPAGMPLWAFRQLEDLKLTQAFVDWWIDNRQVPYGDFGGGISDDTDLTQQWPGLALMGVEPDKINASLRALDDAAYKNGMIVGGLAYITTDELHAYEEGLNSDAERLYLNWGEPRAVERLMATVKALHKVILRNPAGHLHFASSWYGGRKIYRDDAWAWQKPYAFVVMHAPILIGLYNENAQAQGLVTGVVDGLMAHGKKDANGVWTYPNEINWTSDAERKGDGGGLTTWLQSAWAAWRFTGDDKYLAPLRSRVVQSGAGTYAQMNENVFAVLPDGADLANALTPKSLDKGGDFARYAAWYSSGNRDWLAALHGDAIADKAQHLYMNTEGHWWSDRVEAPNETLQRERLGGIALKRNQTWPGNTVSWRFDNAADATRVAILVPQAGQTRFRVIAYNSTDHAVDATMSTWNVTAGRWRVKLATSTDGGNTLTPDGAQDGLVLGRSESTRVRFAPGTTTVLDYELVEAGTPMAARPDLGIGRDDVRVSGRVVTLTVHSLGAKPVSGGTATITDADGKVLARAAIPALDAPTDLLPKTATVTFRLPVVPPPGAVVRVALPDGGEEVTMLNNRIALADAAP